MTTVAQVAVPLPLEGGLFYRVPGPLSPRIHPGVRVRVPVQKRVLSGVILSIQEDGPGELELKDIVEVVDREPVVTRELLELASFVATYYLAPIGEVVRSMLPSGLPEWGRLRVRLTDAGALGPSGGSGEEADDEVLQWLREVGPTRATDLQMELGLVNLPEVLDRLEETARVRLGTSRGGSGGYRAAYTLARGEAEDLVTAAGRSAAGRGVIRHLATLGRPAFRDEILAAVGCSEGVLRRLDKLGVVRRFDEPPKDRLAGQLLRPQPEVLRLREEQAFALDALAESLEARVFRAFLLCGLTGSGKTEVYLRAAEQTLALGRSVILLVPEIALVPAVAGEAKARFGERLAILHSALSRGDRAAEWERIRKGEAQVVLGPRSAVFAPVSNLGLVVVDEEQDGAYKQESTPRYHGRDVALYRASREKAVVVLASATPSLESRQNVSIGKASALYLAHRAGTAGLPEGVLVDLRKEGGAKVPGDVTLSERLRAELERSLGEGEQVILLRNRRGYSPVYLCRACGEDHRCDDCGIPRTHHQRQRRLVCHYCGSTRPVPAVCEACGEDALQSVGSGTERVEETFAGLYPDVTTAVLDRDTVRQPGGAAAVLERFGRGDAQVLIGTQMVSKGHHFPKVGLAVVLAADSYLGFPDFRAVERTYTLLAQLGGRAGRGDLPGRVVIQTYHPDHYAIQAALNHDDERFAEEEMRFRRIFHYPPYTRMVQILVQDTSRQRASEVIEEVASELLRKSRDRDVRLLGPAPAPLERLRNRWRFQLLLRAVHGSKLRTLIQSSLPARPRSDITVDVDPYSLL